MSWGFKLTGSDKFNSVTLLCQICRVEDINIAGLIKGSVVHFHRARTIAVHSTGTISASGMGKLYRNPPPKKKI